MTTTPDQIEAVHSLPLRHHVRWIDLSWLDPGLVIEEQKRAAGQDGEFKFGAVRLESSECAARAVQIHNDWLDANAGGQVGA